MQRRSRFAALASSLLLFLAAGCGTMRVEYVGETFPATETMDIFFDQKDISRPYKNVGEVVGTMPENSRHKTKQLQDKMVAEAKLNGADAILFGSVRAVTTAWSGGSNYYELVLKGTLLKYTDQ
jgi:hypothetical protein